MFLSCRNIVVYPCTVVIPCAPIPLLFQYRCNFVCLSCCNIIVFVESPEVCRSFRNDFVVCFRKPGFREFQYPVEITTNPYPLSIMKILFTVPPPHPTLVHILLGVVFVIDSGPELITVLCLSGGGLSPRLGLFLVIWGPIRSF